jgi:hypothetical protein
VTGKVDILKGIKPHPYKIRGHSVLPERKGLGSSALVKTNESRRGKRKQLGSRNK